MELGVDRLGALGGEYLQRLAQRQTGSYRVGQRDHGVGQLVFDFLLVPLGHPPQQVPGHRCQEHRKQHGEDQVVQQKPETRKAGGDHHQPNHQVAPQTPGGSTQPAQLVGQVFFDRVKRRREGVAIGVDRDGHRQSHRQAGQVGFQLKRHSVVSSVVSILISIPAREQEAATGFRRPGVALGRREI